MAKDQSPSPETIRKKLKKAKKKEAELAKVRIKFCKLCDIPNRGILDLFLSRMTYYSCITAERTCTSVITLNQGKLLFTIVDYKLYNLL